MTTPQGPEGRARHFLFFHSRYFEPGSTGIGYFRNWIDEFKRGDAEAFTCVCGAARMALNSDAPVVRRSAMQVLANIGTPEDVAAVELLRSDSDRDVAADAAICADELQYRLMPWHERLERVGDRESFVRFVHALADEREQAAEIERQHPERYSLDGALDWKNASIPEYLGACTASLDPDRDIGGLDLDQPSWRLFAEFLYFGKIYE